MHGEFEEISNFSGSFNSFKNIPAPSFIKKIKNINFSIINNFIINFLVENDPLNRYFKNKSLLSILKKMGDNCRFIVLSNHIAQNASKTIDLNQYNIKTIYYPQIRSTKLFKYNNENVKFGIFGYGDTKVLYNINLKLLKSNLRSNFEIKIIGMDNRGIEKFPWMSAPSNGRTLNRNQMEELLEDIDFLLILYTDDKYNLSCSASIIEAISYCKPILHLKNDCISHFNQKEKIGYQSNNIDLFVEQMERIINNYGEEKIKLKKFQSNIIKLQKSISVESNLKEFQSIFY